MTVGFANPARWKFNKYRDCPNNTNKIETHRSPKEEKQC